MAKLIFRLVHDEAKKNAKAAIDAAGADGSVKVCVIQDETRTLEQNALVHVRLQELGASLSWEWNGAPVDIDDLKTIFVAAYRKATGQNVRFAIGIDGQPVVLGWRTRDFTKREASEFIEYVDAWEAMNVG